MLDCGKISVIVPVYGVERCLEKCINSICNQTYKNIEIIIVDDGSPDKCPEICDELALKDSRIVVIHKENAGVGSARNEGLDKATGEYIGFVDSDDYIEEDMYEMMLIKMKDDNSDIVECSANMVDEQYNVIGQCQFNDEVIDGEMISKNFLTKKNSEDYVHWRLFKKEVIGDLRFPNLKCSEDYVFLSKVNLNCKRKSTMKNKLYNYLIRATSVGGQPFSTNRFDVIEARNIMREYYEGKGMLELSASNSVQALSRIVDLYIQMVKSDFEEKDKYKKVFMLEYKKHYKNALKDKEFFNGKKLRKVKYFLFKLNPTLYTSLFSMS